MASTLSRRRAFSLSNELSANRTVDRGQASALYEQIAEILGCEIRAGKRAPFSKLPSEHELIAQFGVSRVTVRQALRSLADAGLITARQGKGAYVAGPVVSQELNALRGFYDGLVAQGYHPQATVLRFEPRDSNGAPTRLGADIYRFRRLYCVGDMPIAIADVTLPGFGVKVTRQDVEQHPVYALLAQVIGREVVRATAQVRAGHAPAAIARLLGVAPRSALLHMERSSFDGQGLMLESTHFHLRPEVFAMQIDVSGPLQIGASIRRIDK